jgi:molybdopterin converting factor small subunit
MDLQIRVLVHGRLREEVGRERLSLQLPEGSRVVDAIRAVGLSGRVDVWVLLDGNKAERDASLSDGCELTFFQPTGGG